jgi:alcohol dehydrogenase (cytochrome c)
LIHALVRFTIFTAALVSIGGGSIVGNAQGTETSSADASGTAGDDTSWPLYNLNLRGDRFADLADINTANVARLKEVCRVRMDSTGSSFQVGLILVNGLLYATTGRATAAIDPADCTVVWKSVYTPQQREPFPPVNRGVAVAAGRVVRGRADCRLMALDALTGEQLWLVDPCNPVAGEYFSAAPIVWHDKIFLGLGGGDLGIQGRIFAFDAATGRTLWQFNTIPYPGEVGADTWKGDSWKTGGGGSWTSYTLDSDTGELFVSVGNPAADFNSESRPGANLFTNSVVVLNATTGKLKWWYQASLRDDKDYDLGAAPILYALPNGKPVVAVASKDGYLYVIDRTSHRLVFKTAVTTILNSSKPLNTGGFKVCPGVLGGVEWNGPAYDRPRRAVVVGAVDWCSVNKKDPKPEYKYGKFFLGGSFTLAAERPSGWITSIDDQTGRVRWTYHADGPVVSGITPTSGGLILAGDMSGNLLALDSADGTVLFKQQTGGAIAGGVITYRLAQRQYIAVASGNLSRMTWGDGGVPHLVIYALPAPSNPVARVADTVHPAIIDGNRDHGAGLYAKICASCHGTAGEGLTGPKLTGIGRRLSTDDIARSIRLAGRRPGLPNGGQMPPLYPSVLSDNDVADLATFLHTW